MSLEDICPHLDERIEEYRKTRSPLKKYYICCDLVILRTTNPNLYNKYLRRIEIQTPELYKHLNTTYKLQ